MLNEIALILAGLAGLGAFISMITSVLKQIGVIKDGYGEMWYQGISLLVFIAVAVVYLLKVPVSWGEVNGWLELFTFVLGYIVQLLGGQLAYNTMKGTPIIGFSFEKNAERAEEKIEREPVG